MKFVPSRLVAGSARTIVRETAWGLSRVSPDPHDVLVKMVPGMSIFAEGRHGFGTFHLGDGGRPIIHVAGERPHDLDEAEWLGDMLPSTVAHEWAHYEQFRDGKPIQKRGVVVRTRTLLRLIEGRGNHGE